MLDVVDDGYEEHIVHEADLVAMDCINMLDVVHHGS